MTVQTRIRLTARELSTILGVAGDALDDEGEYLKDLTAFESGMDKLRALLGRKRRSEQKLSTMQSHLGPPHDLFKIIR